jgi:hypothetical protein
LINKRINSNEYNNKYYWWTLDIFLPKSHII